MLNCAHTSWSDLTCVKIIHIQPRVYIFWWYCCLQIIIERLNWFDTPPSPYPWMILLNKVKQSIGNLNSRMKGEAEQFLLCVRMTHP